MNKAQNFGLLASVVFAVGMIGLNLSDGTFVLNQADSSAMASAAGIMGHIEVIHTDSEGNILSYLQTDNSITNKGVNCTMVMLFGAPVDAEQCNGAQTVGSYDIIAVDSADMSAALDLNSNKTATQIRTNGFIPVDDATVTITQVADGTTAAEVDGIVRISKTFTATGAQTVFGASLINSTGTTGYGLFAYKDFGTGGGSIALNTNDQLTVNWDITINGGGAEETP